MVFSPLAGGSLVPKFFVRLRMSDFPVANQTEAENADFDGDGIPNKYELEVLGSDPLDGASNGGDSDADGLSDGWEQYHFGNLSEGFSDSGEGDGLTNGVEQLIGSNPTVAYEALNPSSEIAHHVYTPN